MSCDWRARIDVYLDGELPESEVAAIEQHLKDCPSCAAEALGRLQLKRSIGASAFCFTPSNEFQRRLKASLAGEAVRPRTRLSFRGLPALAACLAAVLVAAVMLWALRTRPAGEENLAEMVDLHVAATGSTNPVDVVSSDRHTVKPWFQGRVPFAFNLPELGGTGYTLLGGKVVYIGERSAAQLIYELRKHEISAFITREAARDTGVRAGTRNGFSLESWSSGGLHYELVGDTSAQDVHALGDLLRAAAKQ